MIRNQHSQTADETQSHAYSLQRCILMLILYVYLCSTDMLDNLNQIAPRNIDLLRNQFAVFVCYVMVDLRRQVLNRK